MKIKLFQGVNVDSLEKEVNAFLIDKDIVDVRWSTKAVKTKKKKNEYTLINSVMIMYK